MVMRKRTLQELEAAIRKHNDLYFVKHRPEISDEEFDRLVEELKQLKPSSPVLRAIGSDITKVSKTVLHEIPMLSLDKCYSEKEMHHWFDKFEGEILATPKIDGCAVALRYGADGRLTLAATRGSGTEGEVITPNAKYISEIPQKIGLKNVEVRGEVYMPLSVFKKFSETFANPRNLAAGAIKQKDPKKTGDYPLSFFGYDLLHSGAATEMEKRKWLKKEKFPIVDGKLVSRKEIQKIFDDYFKKRNIWDYETDGVVFKVNSVVEQERLGATAHHPRYAIAYKFQGDYGETTLRDVLWSVSRTGTITPVGIVDPVVLSGATVTRVSLHNYGLIKKMGVTLPSKVLMVRRGGVIPNLEKVIESRGRPLVAPKHCPSCGSAVELRDDFLFCGNPKKCSVSKIGELDHFVKVVGIDGFGKKLLKQLYDKNRVEDPSDFYALTVEALLPLERMGKTLATKLVDNVQNKKELSLDVFLRALGIPELGKHVAKILARFETLEKVLQVTIGDLTAIHGIGDKIAGRVVVGLKDKRGLIDGLLKYVKVQKSVGPLLPGPLSGKSFLFTGTLLAMERSKAQALVEAKGGIAASGVSKNLDYLVVGDGGGAGSKLNKVKKLQQQGAAICVLNEKEFVKVVG